MLNFLKALSVFTGTIIGVGIFGLPYVASKAGFPLVFFYFLFLTIGVILVHLLWGEVCLGTKKLHRLPGYVEEYLGTFWKKISFLIFGLGLIGTLLAYLIVGGEFLKFFLTPYFGENSLIYTLLFFAPGAFLIFRGIKNISQIEFVLLILLLVIIIIFFIKALPFINLNYFKSVDLKFFIFPYGIVLFSLWGSAVIPEIKEMVFGDREMLKKVIISGILISTITYLIFIFIIFGTSGPATSQEAISGFVQAIGDNVIRLGFIFGIITCFTSFLTLGLTFKKVLWYDFGLSKNLSWFVACFLPLFLFLIGLRKFIDVIGFTGAVVVGLEGIIIIFLYQEFLKKKFFKTMNPLFYILSLCFILGIILETIYFISK